MFDVVERHGVTKLGLMVNQSIGCVNEFGTRLVQQSPGEIAVVDFATYLSTMCGPP
jgi:hypothetical protein